MSTRNKFIAAQFQVRSIPTVYAMFQGQPVADLTSARTESQLAAMLDQLLAKLPIKPGGGDAGPQQDLAPLLAMGAGAGQRRRRARGLCHLFTEIVVDRAHKASAAGMIRSAGRARPQGRGAGHPRQPEGEERADPALERRWASMRARAALEVRDPEEVRLAEGGAPPIRANPGRSGRPVRLANALIAAGDRDAAADTLLPSSPPTANGTMARRARGCLQIFSMIGLEDPWVAATRRGFPTILFG
jgi:putative thioredoxin